MVEEERRKHAEWTRAQLRADLNDAQRASLSELELEGWELKFIRRPIDAECVPIVFDPERNAYAVIRSDGAVEEPPDLRIRA